MLPSSLDSGFPVSRSLWDGPGKRGLVLRATGGLGALPSIVSEAMLEILDTMGAPCCILAGGFSDGAGADA